MSCNILSMSSSLFNTSVSDKVLSARLQSSCIASDLSSVFVSKSLVPVNFVQITRLRRFSVQSVWSKEFRNGNFKVKTKSVVEKNDEVNHRGDDSTLDREEIKERRGVQYHKSEGGARNENSVSTKRRGSGISLDGSDELTNRYDYLSGFSSDSKRNGRFLDSNYKTSRENANSEGLETQRKGNSIYFSAQSRRNSWNSMGSVSKSSKNSTSNSSAKTKSRSQGEYSSTRGRVGRNSDLSYSSDTLGSRRKKNPTLFKEKMIDDGLGISESNIVNNSLDIRRFPPKESSEREDKNNEVTTREMPSNGSDNVDRIDSAANSTSESHLTHTRFDQYPLSSLTLKAITDAGYERMTVVQEATLPYILKGKDVLAKAKTGTGKTVAFLLPAIEAIVKLPPSDLHLNRAIIVLVICPTRELANQAAAEARTLLKYHSTIGVQVVIGGTRLSSEQRNMQSFPCQILVATPGRLQDHIENTPGFSARLKGMKVLVLDEADHLLDMGFRKDIERTLTSIPKQRQTLLFSATIPEEVLQICHIALKKDHEFINTVEEGTEETHSQVRQMNLVAPLSRHFSLVYSILREHIVENDDYKVLIFCTTAMVTRLVADLLSKLNLNVREIHSRKTQSYRTRVSDEFRRSKGLILVTSDVSARGVDYPDVTLVIQIGVPADREQYIHRLGRTGRKGKEGKGILLLAPWEAFFLHDIKDLPISKVLPPPVDLETQAKVERALSTVEDKNKEVAYQAWLGYYNSNKNVGSDKTRLVELANEFSRSMGMDKPPRISKQILGKMGLRNVPGLNVKK